VIPFVAASVPLRWRRWRSSPRLVLPVLLLSIACGRDGGGGGERAVGPAPLTVRVATAERVDAALRTEVAGTVAAARSAAISSRVMAMVNAVHVELGDEVNVGQALISIDPAAAEGQVLQARGALAQAEAALALAQRNHQRYQALAASYAASQLEVDLARTQMAQAEGAVEQARGAVQAASAVARESQVVAPFSGRVAARLVEVGDLVAPGRPLVMLDSRTGRRLVVAVAESLLQRAGLAVGGELAVSFDARPDLGEVTGRVVEISPGPDPATHAYTVKVDLPLDGIAAGAAGRAYLTVGRRTAVSIPRQAIVESGGLTLVVVRDEQGRAQSRVVTLGEPRPDDRVEVLSGLAGGESVALGLVVAPVTGSSLEVSREVSR
jgi:RND family efflux transporter MFP subunit